MRPSYLEAYTCGTLDKIIERARGLLKKCSLCPRACGIDRLKDQKAFCHTGLKARVFSYLSHRGEEPPISGYNGSGTIFFSGCNMACAYCQNHEFSQKEAGREVGREELAGFMLELQEQGCHNINLVTPTHVMPQILEALKIAAAGGLHIPLVYNSGGFELPGVLKLLEGIVDIYLPDMRYSREDHAIKYSSAPAYPHYNRMAIKEMHRQVGIARINQDGIIEKGLIVRHLVLPNGLAGTQEAMEFLATEISQDTYVSLMSQYLPRYRSSEFIELSRRLKREEYACAQKTLEEHGLANGWSQEETTPERFAGTNLKPNL